MADQTLSLSGGASRARPGWPARPKLPRYVREYLRMVRTQLILVFGDADAVQPQALRTIVFRDEADCDWADIFAIEDALIALIPDAAVYDSVSIWRTRYRQIVGSALYDEYLKTKPPDPTAAHSDALAAAIRQDMLALAARIHYAYAFNPPKEKMRNRLSIFNAASIVLVGLAIFGQAFWRHIGILSQWVPACAGPSCGSFTSLEVVVLAGVLGGFISVQQRLQSWSDVDPLYKRLEISSGWFSITAIAPVIGAIFACVLYTIFFAGAITGSLFPEFGTPPGYGFSHQTTGIDFDGFLKCWPKVPADWAKLMLWSFIAGFAERFVPDVLSRLANVQYALGGTSQAAKS
jgi:hypothetical protein